MAKSKRWPEQDEVFEFTFSVEQEFLRGMLVTWPEDFDTNMWDEGPVMVHIGFEGSTPKVPGYYRGKAQFCPEGDDWHLQMCGYEKLA